MRKWYVFDKDTLEIYDTFETGFRGTRNDWTNMRIFLEDFCESYKRHKLLTQAYTKGYASDGGFIIASEEAISHDGILIYTLGEDGKIFNDKERYLMMLKENMI